ncbi:hypothetical protein QYE76_001187 [Lolium multiflorum]|uniref:Uncharacterized protein n=1 Tax=Lolium multiflorum TaxID=4521 RepID=A0AAD8RLK3_LOLMU|nr:hypothetical protein QYE76_001187 [Lolium multiflorum]
MRGEGRRRRHVPSGTHAIIRLTAPLSFLTVTTALSPPQTVTSPGGSPSADQSAARRITATGGGDVGDEDLDIGRNQVRSPLRHLVFARDLELVLGRKNGGNNPSFSPSYSFCSNMPFWGISDDMHSRSARTEKLKLGSPQTPDEGPSKKRRAANVGHFQPDVAPDQFLRIIFIKPTFERLRIPRDFVRWFGEVPSNIGWAAFAVAHQLQIGQFLVFKKVSTFQFNVVIFDYTCTEVMTMCGYHGEATRCVVFQSHV